MHLDGIPTKHQLLLIVVLAQFISRSLSFPRLYSDGAESCHTLEKKNRNKNNEIELINNKLGKLNLWAL